MIARRSVSKTYAGGDAAALIDGSLEVRRGEVFGVIGRSGAGAVLIDVVTRRLSRTPFMLIVPFS